MKAIILLLAMAVMALATTPNLVVYGTSYGVNAVPELAEGEYYVGVWGGSRARHVIALTSEGELLAWGDNSEGQCDIPGDLPSFPVVPISAAASLTRSYVAFSDGSVRWWGEGSSGSYGPGHPLWVTQVAVDMDYHSIFLREDGTIYPGPGVTVPAPNQDWTYIAAGSDHYLGVKENGSVICWGSNSYGQLDVPDSGPFVAVAGGWYHSLGLKEDGSIAAWGYNFYGQCTIPAPNTGFVSIAAGENHSVALKASGLVKAWGSNSYGQCGINGMVGVEAIAAGASYSVALLPPPTGIDSVSFEGIPQLSLSAFPNPSNGYLEFSLTNGGEVDVYDVSGRIVSLVSIPQSGSVSWTAPTTGVYFASVRGSDTPATRFVIVR